MTNDIQPSTHTEHKPIPFGARLKTAREALGLERKDAASQLRLNEKIILMMEKERYPSDLPATFIRGYIRAYGKLLQIPEYEIKKAIEPIKHKANPHPIVKINNPTLDDPMTSSNYFMQFFTYLVIFTLIGLVGVWWYSHNNQQIGIENSLTTLNTETTPPKAPSLNVNQTTQSAPPHQTTTHHPASRSEETTLPVNPVGDASTTFNVNQTESLDHSSQETIEHKPTPKNEPSKVSVHEKEESTPAEETEGPQEETATEANPEINNDESE